MGRELAKKKKKISPQHPSVPVVRVAVSASYFVVVVVVVVAHWTFFFGV